MNNKPSKSSVISANIELHTALADVYNKEEPHWRPENIERVTSKLQKIKEKTNGTKLLDLGCGTGFIINIAKNLKFTEIQGFDITKAMTDQIDRNYPEGIVNVTLRDTAEIDSPSNYFDVATAYTFLSHLDDISPTLKQAYRCLKPGGMVYSDLDPNAAFWESLNKLDSERSYDEYIDREIKHTKHIDRLLFEKYKISPEVYNIAEFQKTQSHGLSKGYIEKVLTEIGFKNVVVTFEWFVGQGIINNDLSLTKDERALKIDAIETYLRKMEPLSNCLFKYISFTAQK